jgi:hypothetical protein
VGSAGFAYLFRGTLQVLAGSTSSSCVEHMHRTQNGARSGFEGAKGAWEQHARSTAASSFAPEPTRSGCLIRSLYLSTIYISLLRRLTSRTALRWVPRECQLTCSQVHVSSNLGGQQGQHNYQQHRPERSAATLRPLCMKFCRLHDSLCCKPYIYGYDIYMLFKCSLTS